MLPDSFDSESHHIDLIQILIQFGFDSNCLSIILLKSAISNKTNFDYARSTPNGIAFVYC